MDVLDRYLNAVRTFLPKGEEEDILRELRDDLMSRMEDREGALGRALTEAEKVAMLRQHGHPLTVAGRYLSDGGHLAFGRTLIGPVLFPFYLRVLGLVLAITAAVVCVGGWVAILMGGSAGPMLSNAVSHLALTFTIVTAIFVALDRRRGNLGDGWERASQGAPGWSGIRVEGPFAAGEATPGAPGQRQAWWKEDPKGIRMGLVAEIVVLAILVGVFLTLPDRMPVIFFGPLAEHLRPGPSGPLLVKAGVVVMSLHILVDAAVLLAPDLARARRIGQAATHALGLGALVWLYQQQAWHLVAGDLVAKGRNLAEAINEGMRMGMGLLVPVLAIGMLIQIYQAVRRG